MGLNLYVANNYLTIEDLNEAGVLAKTSTGNRTYPATTLGEGFVVGSSYLVNATTLATGKIYSVFYLASVSATTAATPVYTSAWRGVPLVSNPEAIVQVSEGNRTYPVVGDDDLPIGSLFVVNATTLATGKVESVFMCLDNSAGAADWKGVALYADPAQVFTAKTTAPTATNAAPLGSKWYVNAVTVASMAVYEVVKVRSSTNVAWKKLTE